MEIELIPANSCPKCSELMKLVKWNGLTKTHEYWYCTTCKKELDEIFNNYRTLDSFPSGFSFSTHSLSYKKEGY